MKKQISIFGSTGSIGKNTVELVKNHLDLYEIVALVAANNAELLIEQSLLLKPKFVVIKNEESYQLLKNRLSSLNGTEVFAGEEAILEIAKVKCDLFVSAIVGSASMLPTLNAIKAGSNIALANKESLVCAGDFMIEEAKASKVKIIPVDSEHNAIFQIFENDNLDVIRDIILTASGGPFFNSDKDLSKVSVAEAIKHPNWSMGAKISVDSATMMNKGLEMIEAYRLFPIAKNQIKILIHPQSIVHGLVNYDDGSSLAMLSNPDMKIPISYALSYPKRLKINHEHLNLAKIKELTFFEVDEQKFPAVNLCKQAMDDDDNSATILNAANEVAVERFLNKEISFTDIVKIVAATLDKIPNQKLDSIEDVIEFDGLARISARQIKF
jgi:1-deoxy-D-xylulose-5-phosphate reductoisomerase